MSRRRFRYDEATKTMVEVGADWTDTPRLAQTPTEELTYGGLAATDGTLINTRKKHREYMQRNGLTVAGDFTNTWAKAEQDRASAWTNKQQTEARREALGRALHEAKKGKRR